MLCYLKYQAISAPQIVTQCPEEMLRVNHLKSDISQLIKIAPVDIRKQSISDYSLGFYLKKDSKVKKTIQKQSFQLHSQHLKFNFSFRRPV
jgi:hypothetical protein